MMHQPSSATRMGLQRPSFLLLLVLVPATTILAFGPQSVSLLSRPCALVAAAGPLWRPASSCSLPARTSNTAASKSILFQSSASDETTAIDDNSDNEPEYADSAKHTVATGGMQFSLLAGMLKLVDTVVAKNNMNLPVPVVGILFVFLSLRSRVASVLDNSRPNRDAMEGKATPSNVKRPSWTPPGIAFPIIWLTITALRGILSAMVYSNVGQLCCGPLLAMILHLCIGDTWKTITNVEKRLGASAAVCTLVWASVWNAIYRYYQVVPKAGYVLAPSGVWITIATVLTFSIWRLNTPIQPLYPVKGNGKSASFKWKNLGQLEPTSIRGGN